MSEQPGSTYYFSNQGDDAADGLTPQTAWRTLDPLLRITGCLPGDTYLFRGGDTFTDNLEVYAGDPARPMTFSSYGDGRATWRPADSLKHVLAVYGAGGLHVRRLNFAGPGREMSEAAGLFYANGGGYVGPGDNVVFEELEVSGFHIGIGGVPQLPGVRGVVVRRCFLHHNALGMKLAHGEPSFLTLIGPEITDNVIGHSGRSKVDGSDGPNAEGIALWNATGFVVERNLIHDTGDAGGGEPGYAAVTLCYCDGGVVRNNVIARTRFWVTTHPDYPGANDGQGVSVNNCRNVLIERNFFEDNDGPAWQIEGAAEHPTWNIVVRFNVVQRGYGLSWVNGWCYGVQVYNNDGWFDAAGSVVWTQGASVAGGGVQCTYANNLIAIRNPGPHVKIMPDGPPESINVHYLGNHYDPKLTGVHGDTDLDGLDGWRLLTGQETVDDVAVGSEGDCLLVNPGTASGVMPATLATLANHYGRRDGSPIKARGVSLSRFAPQPVPGTVVTDILGHPVDWDRPSVGAIQQEAGPV